MTIFRSVVVLDNWSVHCSIEGTLQAAINAKGGVLLWNPQNSPDLNPIEKLWDVVLSKCVRFHQELALNLHGPARPFVMTDLCNQLTLARLETSKVVDDMINKVFE